MVPIKELLSEEIASFIHKNRKSDIAGLMLKIPPFKIDAKWVAAQIEGWQKASVKLPLWASNDRIVYPVRLSMEQCSSEKTAQYKASLVKGDYAIDLTGGFGVDTFFLSKNFSKVIYIEQQEELTEIAAHNFIALGQLAIEVRQGISENILKTITDKVDLIYLDPARRKESQKVYKLSDCDPNVVDFLDLYFSLSDIILIKTSPMLDITEATRQLKGVKEIHIISVDQECKEVLYLLNKEYIGEALFVCVHNFKNTIDRFVFNISEETIHKSSISEPLYYLYEPNASILKAGAFNSITKQFDVHKLHPSTHLYTSNHLIIDFPGRSFVVKKIVGYNKKEIHNVIETGKANIQTRNFPDSVETIRKKIGLKDGGNIYVFATTLSDGRKVLLICEKPDLLSQQA